MSPWKTRPARSRLAPTQRPGLGRASVSVAVAVTASPGTSPVSAPGMPYAHPTVEHFAPLFIILGAVARPDNKPEYAIEGYAHGSSKRSFEAR